MMELSDICPVCGMKAEAEVVPVKQQKEYFYFCSEQCRETFIVHPALYNLKVEKKRNEILKRRTMRLAFALDCEITDLIRSYLMDMMGLKAVKVKDNKMQITYDLLQVTESQIEKALMEVGVRLGEGWLERLRRAWVHDGEESELDNLAAPPAASYTRLPPKN